MAKQQHTKYGGRWVLNEDGQQMIFVVEPEHPPIPDQVIPLPDPPSDCDNSAMMMSDGSLTMSCFDPDPDMDTTDTDTDIDTDMDHIVPNHTPIYYDYMNENADVGDENHAGQHDIYTNKNNNYDHYHQHSMMIERSDDTGNIDTDETTIISSTMDDSHCHDNRTSTSNIGNDNTAMITPDLEEGQQQQHPNNSRTAMIRQQQQRQHQSIFVNKTKNKEDDNNNRKNSSININDNNNNNNKNSGSKKRVTLFVEPEKEAKDKKKNEKKKKLMTKQQHKKEKKNNNSNSNRTSCYHTLMYCVFGVSLLAIVIGGGGSAMIYFGIININVNASTTTTIDNSSSNNNNDTTSNSSSSSSDSDNNSDTPIVSGKDTTTTTNNNNNNNSSISTNVAPISELVATNTPTVVDSSSSSSVEYWMIVDILRDEFHLVVPTNNDHEEPTPMNQAIDWFVEELQLFPTYMDHYHDLAKFAQRFALVTMKFSLLGHRDGKGCDDDGGGRHNDNDNDNDEDADADADIDPSTEPPQSQQQSVFNYFPFQQTQGDDECHWEGIQCDSEGNRRVIAVDFSDSELRGTIPVEIRFLYHLQHLDLSTNHIQGSIPEELFDLRHLQRFYLYHNDLTGTISPYIGQLKSLQYLHLSHNSLTGTIPSQLGGASSGMTNDDEFSSPLKYMNIYDNKITGTIPTNLRLHNLTYFDVGRNFIGGSIPDDIGADFMELRYLHIDHNRFTETIPDTIPPMANGRLLSFLANNNRLEGYVPDNWSRYNKLVQYTLQNNYFDELGPNNCNFSVFHQGGGSNNGELIEFKADCDICSCNDIFCDSMCAGR